MSCSTSSTSPWRLTASSRVMPTWISSGGIPLTTPISSQPAVRWSSIANSSATRQGVAYGVTVPSTPSRSVLVRPATVAVSRFGDGL